MHRHFFFDEPICFSLNVFLIIDNYNKVFVFVSGHQHGGRGAETQRAAFQQPVYRGGLCPALHLCRRWGPAQWWRPFNHHPHSLSTPHSHWALVRVLFSLEGGFVGACRCVCAHPVLQGLREPGLWRLHNLCWRQRHLYLPRLPLRSGSRHHHLQTSRLDFTWHSLLNNVWTPFQFPTEQLYTVP